MIRIKTVATVNLGKTITTVHAQKHIKWFVKASC